MFALGRGCVETRSNIACPGTIFLDRRTCVSLFQCGPPQAGQQGNHSSRIREIRASMQPRPFPAVRRDGHLCNAASPVPSFETSCSMALQSEVNNADRTTVHSCGNAVCFPAYMLRLWITDQEGRRSPMGGQRRTSIVEVGRRYCARLASFMLRATRCCGSTFASTAFFQC